MRCGVKLGVDDVLFGPSEEAVVAAVHAREQREQPPCRRPHHQEARLPAVLVALTLVVKAPRCCGANVRGIRLRPCSMKVR